MEAVVSAEHPAATTCTICMGTGRVFRYEITDPRNHSPISVTHAVPVGDPCPNCKGTGRV
jgi:RecJ-like exonuclease